MRWDTALSPAWPRRMLSPFRYRLQTWLLEAPKLDPQQQTGLQPRRTDCRRDQADGTSSQSSRPSTRTASTTVGPSKSGGSPAKLQVDLHQRKRPSDRRRHSPRPLPQRRSAVDDLPDNQVAKLLLVAHDRHYDPEVYWLLEQNMSYGGDALHCILLTPPHSLGRQTIAPQTTDGTDFSIAPPFCLDSETGALRTQSSGAARRSTPSSIRSASSAVS